MDFLSFLMSLGFLRGQGGGGSGGTAGVTSWNGRRNAVYPRAGDYNASQINTAESGKTVQAKIDEFEQLIKPDAQLSTASIKTVENRVVANAIEDLKKAVLPEGGVSGDFLVKRSNARWGAQWVNGDNLMKKTDYDRDENGKVDKADKADAVQGPLRVARLRNTQADTYLLTDEDKGKANGVVPLDSNGKILPQYLPDMIMYGLTKGGVFDASTRTVTLSEAAKSILGVTADTMVLENSATTPTGYPANADLYYITNTGGTFAGMTFNAGDWLISLGNQWQQFANGSQVSSVQGKTGAVRIDSDEVPEGTENLYMTPQEKAKLLAIEEEATKDVDVLQSASVVTRTDGTKFLRLTNKNGQITEFDGGEGGDLEEYLKKTGDASQTTVSYTPPASRNSFTGYERLEVFFGKVAAWFRAMEDIAFSGDYADLKNAPTKLSQFINDGNGNAAQPFITRTADNLLYYYTKDGVYSKEEIDALLDSISSFNFILADELPTTNIQTKAIYYVPAQGGLGYDRWQRIGNQWAHLGTTDVDMAEYLKTNGNGSNVTAQFTAAAERTLLESGETLSAALGKIDRYIRDLKAVCFSGSWQDLDDGNELATKVDLEDYVPIQQDVNMAGKVLGIGDDGKVTPVDGGGDSVVKAGSGMRSIIGNDLSQNVAFGAHSTAFGEGTASLNMHQFSIGRYNSAEPGTIFTVGNGVSGARSNAFAVDINGNAYIQKEVFAGNDIDNIVEPSTASSLTTKRYVDRTIDEEIAKADLLRSMVVAAVPELEDADSNVLYLVPDPTSEGHYLQYKKVLKSQNPDVYEMANLGGTQLTMQGSQVEILPTPSAAYAGKVYQFVGSSSGGYIKGANYTCIVRPFYAWLRVGDANNIYFTEHAPVIAKEYVYRGKSGWVGPICALTASGDSATFTDGLGNTYTRMTSEDLSNYYQWSPLFTKLSDFTTDGAEITTVADDTKFSSVDLQENKINYVLGSKLFTWIWGKIKGSKWTNAVNADNQGSDVIPSASAVYNSIGKRILVNQYSVPDSGQTVAQVLTSAGLNIAGGYACAYVRNTAKISNRPFTDGGAVYVEVIARDTTTRIVRWTNWIGDRSMTCSQTNGTWNSWYETGGGTVTEGANDNAISYSTPTSQGYKITGNYSSTTPPRAFKTGKVVNLSFHCTGTATAIGAGWTTIGVVNSLYRPKYQVPIVAMVYDGNNGNQAAGGYINTGGSVVLWTNPKSATNNYQVRLNVTYITN